VLGLVFKTSAGYFVPRVGSTPTSFRHTMLLCSVRNCHKVLVPEAKRLVCPQGHSFDIARSGYINLLQPQDRRSRQPGDTMAAVAARRRLHDRNVTEPLVRGIADFSCANSGDKVLDAGCGDGYILSALAREIGFAAHGVDISVPAVQAAARHYPGCEWVVANADRFIPYEQRSFSLVLSITARMNSAEFRRVLRDDGRLLVAVPAPDDLIELRGSGRDRVDRTVDLFASDFRLVDRRRIVTTADLDAGGVQDVLVSIYRPLRRSPAGAMRLTFALDVLQFRVR
jgi:23S rRNA (guanine745-N1)-methyltransferase